MAIFIEMPAMETDITLYNPSVVSAGIVVLKEIHSHLFTT
jgi:hypothetical protein